jgi:hypothetical protein
MDMLNVPGLPLLRKPQYRLAAAFGLGLALVVSGAPKPGHVASVSAQAVNPCALLTADELDPLTLNTSVEGVPTSLPAFGYLACQYVWGVGVGRFKLDVIVNEPSRMFPGMSPEQIKQRLLASVRAGTGDALISEIGEAAVFKPESPVYASAMALVKGRILELRLDGVYAGERKDQVVGLLKSAAARM